MSREGPPVHAQAGDLPRTVICLDPCACDSLCFLGATSYMQYQSSHLFNRAEHTTGIVIPTLSTDGLKATRWHPDIPAFVTVEENEIFKVECVDWTGGQIANTDNADDVRDVKLSVVHHLSGPIAVKSAAPGDVLVVEILDVQPFAQMPWGYTGIFELNNGGGLLAEEFDSKATKAIWDLEGVYATSRHIPGVRFAGIPHPGILGTAPSAELLATWNARERDLIERVQAQKVQPVAHAPLDEGTHVGQSLPDALAHRIAREGARTIPPRENGGNVDIKNLSKGSKCYYPVYVSGANLSVGDLHFSQGDGECSFCGAIEMAGVITMRCNIMKDGVKTLGLKQPIFVPSPIDPLYSDRLIFQGISVDLHSDGRQHSLDTTVSYKQAALNAIGYLMKLGYTREQAYLLLSAAPIDSHIGSIVDVPNACVTLSLPTAMFDRDIMPEKMAFVRRGQAATRSDASFSVWK